ncbi:phage tail length tape-measure protein [Paracoccus yeei]|uniref:Phage tail length tape-measure protein n=1 Tax=Paracoccus yeei TaxID=147645 RepID=A0A386ULF8_9RHOB|nr:phage tail tape measure C-terminal domain-containing protein [Paracoccus yeei]AYF01544.1 phage tail length tape-measure protein [Paracoccus yeei]
MKSEFFRFVSDLSYKWADFLTVFKVGVQSLGFDELSDRLASGPIMDATKTGNDALVASAEAAALANSKLAEAAGLVKDAFGPARDKLAELNSTVETVAASTDAATAGVASLGDAAGGGGKGGRAAGKVAELKTALELLAEEFSKLTEPFDQAGAAFEALTKASDAGVISNDYFAASLKRVQDAFLATGGTADQWEKIVGDKTESVAKKLDELGKKNLTDLGNSFAELATGGSASFGDLAKSIIKDLIAIAWQAMVVKPLLNFMGIPMANGGVVDSGGVQAFAKGGAFTDQVFSAPTPFQFAAGGGFGLVVMGEAGPEAVMPLTRGPDGSLGVQMYGESGAQRAGDSRRVAVDVHVAAEAGEMFRPVVRAEARDVAVGITNQAVGQLNEQLPERINQHLNDPRVR